MATANGTATDFGTRAQAYLNHLNEIERNICGSENAKRTVIARTKSGKKLHLGSRTGTTTHCGLWLKAALSHFEVKASQLRSGAVLCEHCFTADHVLRESPQAAPAVKSATYAFEPYDVLQVNRGNGKGWLDFSTLRTESEGVRAQELVERGEFDGQRMAFRITRGVPGDMRAAVHTCARVRRVGETVIANGYIGTITSLCGWSTSLVEVRLASGTVCVDFNGIDCLPIGAPRAT